MEQDPPPPFDLSTAGLNPQHTIMATSDQVVEAFVASHLGEEVNSLGLQGMRCSEAGVAQLRRLRGLYVLTLTGPWMAEPLRVQEGKFIFKNALSDAVVQEIAQIKSLRVLNLWYGSLSPRQREFMTRLLPKCKVVDNLNKI